MRSATDDRDVIKTTQRNVRQMVALQVLSHGIAFLVNVAAVRAIDAQAYGYVNIQLRWLAALVIALPRGPIQTVCQRIYASSDRATAIAIAWLAIPLGALAALIALALETLLRTDEEATLPNQRYAAWLVLAGALMEVCAEPARALLHARLMHAHASSADAVGVAARCVVLSTFVTAQHRADLLCFAYAWFAHGLAILASMYYIATRNNAFALPSRRGMVGAVRALGAVGRLTAREMVVWCMVEGRAVVLQQCLPLAEQGRVVVVENLGALAARILFRPYEDAHFGLFSRHAALGPAKTFAALGSALRTATAVGLAFACFGPAYSFALLDILYSTRYSAHASLLSLYCMYIPLMAVNGVTEAYVRAVAPGQRDRALVPTAIAHFVFLGVGATIGGAYGAIVAEMLTMVLRLWLSASIIRSNAGARPMRSLILSQRVVTTFLLSGVAVLTLGWWCAYRAPVLHDPWFWVHGWVGAMCLLFCYIMFAHNENSA